MLKSTLAGIWQEEEGVRVAYHRMQVLLPIQLVTTIVKLLTFSFSVGNLQYNKNCQ